MVAQMMRSVQVRKPGAGFEFTEREIPRPGPAEVRVRVHSCGICHSDSLVFEGIPGAVYPLVPGHEISGTVDAVGADVSGFGPGDRVGAGWFGGQCGTCRSCRRGDFVMCAAIKAPGLLRDGGYAQYVVVPATALARVPDELDATHVGPLMCAGVTAFNALRICGTRPGERVAVLGIGGVGHLAVQFARKTGCEVIAISRGDANRRLALDLGAHHYVDALDPSAGDGAGPLADVDVIIATAPAGSAVTTFASCLAPRGRIVVTGFSDEEIRISPVTLISRDISLMGCAAGTAKDAEEALAFSARTGVRPVVEEFPLAQAAHAYERMIKGKVRFRAVLTVDDVPPPASPVTAADHPASGGRTVTTGGAGSVLDCPADYIPQERELIEAAMRWHFSPDTGSAFWLERARRFDFDPRKDIHTVGDLRRFPDITGELRHVRAADLIPRGYGTSARLLGVFESGGATGAPKRVILLRDWLDRWAGWAVRVARLHNYPPNAGWLTLAPTGPHLFGYLLPYHARLLGGTAFAVDMDPRWVRRLVSENRAEEADRYVGHLVAQAERILRSQDIGILVSTPPLLERLARSDTLIGLIRNSVRLITWAGTHMDADTRHFYQTEVFPGIDLRGNYGNTMLLGGAAERVTADGEACIFDPFSPYLSFSVVSPEDGVEVPYGDRGRVVMHHVSKSMFIPNNLDRDFATRVKPLPGQAGDSIADVAPAPAAVAEEPAQGVY